MPGSVKCASASTIRATTLIHYGNAIGSTCAGQGLTRELLASGIRFHTGCERALIIMD